jgi:FkbM family methyltransferase
LSIHAELLRTYTRYTPVSRGKYRLAELARRWWRGPYPETAASRDGRLFVMDRTSGLCDTLFFLGEYERAITEIVREIVHPGDVAVDVGAAFGWYTTLLAELCGPTGMVHAFEPLPEAAALLRRNLLLNGSPTHVRVLTDAIGRAPGATQPLYTFDDLPLGHASLAAGGKRPATRRLVTMTSLDAYLTLNEPRPIAFIKIDAEGGELGVLEGASTIVEAGQPPIWVIEMSVITARAFGWHPNDLLARLGAGTLYDCYAIDERDGSLVSITQFGEGEAGANVLCIPRAGRSAPTVQHRLRERRPDDFRLAE